MKTVLQLLVFTTLLSLSLAGNATKGSGDNNDIEFSPEKVPSVRIIINTSNCQPVEQIEVLETEGEIIECAVPVKNIQQAYLHEPETGPDGEPLRPGSEL